MPQISNIGGSLTSAVVLTLLAWGVRLLRATAQRQQEGSRHGSSGDLLSSLPRFFAALSPAALRMLVELDPIPHVLIVIRGTDAKGPSPNEGNKAQSVPPELASASVQLTERQLRKALSGKQWPTRMGGPSAPSKEHLLVFICEDVQAPKAVAAVAAQAGFQRVSYLAGGAAAFNQPARAQAQAELRFINRDAVSVLVGHTTSGGGGSGPDGALLLDLRRHDERSLYGSIPAAHHVPMDELPAALGMSPAAWQEQYGFPKPSSSSTVVMQCRTNRRASWAAQLAHDAGLSRVLVYKQGVYGWRLDPNVKPYRSYEKWEAPPEPEPVQTESVDVEAARSELEHLGLLHRTPPERSTR
mmetsp:Transcript_15084/g.45563  ORF Transcript_15084/g.45563 Transcript_15084/m.45563 type:complete len:356 (-) Transcript_15084:398-1465(-)